MSPLLVGCSEHMYHLDLGRIHQIPSHDDLCYFNTERLGMSCHRFSWTLSGATHTQHCTACILTCTFPFPPHLTCCRHYQLIQISVLHSWLQILLVPVASWISSKTVLAITKLLAL